VKITPLTEKNVDHVIDNLWNRGRKEAEAFGLTVEDLRGSYYGMIGFPFTGAFYYGNECCALCALESIGLNRWRTHFVATEGGFNHIWLGLTKFLMRISDEMVGPDRDAAYIEILSANGGPPAEGWYTTLGFSKVSQDGEITKYVKGR
jgi:hypothetical protein